MRRFAARSAAFVWVILVPSALYAQASITGTVRDTSGGVLPGATVEASSPALIEKVRSVVTDGTGQYRIIDLRPGTYTVLFTLQGFNPVKRADIELTGSRTATVNADLPVGVIEETLTVSGQSPIVDVQNTRQERVLTREIIDALPSARTPSTLGILVPAVTGVSGTQDVGGTSSLNVRGELTVHGGRIEDFRFMSDGFNIAGGSRFLRSNNFQPNMGSTQELSIDIGGAAAEQTTSGVIVNVVPREGGNRFAGSMFVAGANDKMANDNFTQRVKDKGLATPNTLKTSYDVNPAFGGPIRKDKLWFFSAARWFGYENYTGIFYNRNAGIKDAWTYVPDETRPAYHTSWSRGANTRLTWQINPTHKLSFFYDQQAKCECLQSGNSSFFAQPRGLRVSPEAAPEVLYRPSISSLFLWTATLSSRVLLEVGGAYRRENNRGGGDRQEGDPALDLVPVTDTGLGLVYHGMVEAAGPGASQTSTWYNNAYGLLPQARAALSYVTGAHAFKVGFHQQYVKATESQYGNNSSVGYTFNNGAPISLYQRALPWFNNGSVPWDLGVYAQDKWTIDKLTLNLGVRFSYYTTEAPDQHLGPGLLTPTRNFTVPGTKWYSLKDLTPRIGAAYDLFGTGRTAVKVALNKNLGSPVAASGLPIFTLTNLATRSWTDGRSGALALPVDDPRRGNFGPDCDLTIPAANGECGPLSDQNFGKLGRTTTVDPATYKGWGVRTYNWEFLSGIQHELIPRVSVDIGYFRRMYGNLLATDNRALVPSDYDTYCITTPVDVRLPDGGGTPICGLYDLNPAKTVGGIPVDNYQTFADTYGKQYEHWNGVDVGVTARLRGVLVSGGLSTGRTSTDNCDVVSKLDNPSLLYCHVDTKFLTQVKGYGAYTIPKLEVQVAGTFQSIPGPQLAATLNVPTAQVAQSLLRPLSSNAAQVSVNIIEPGTTYGERLNQLDLRVGKVLKFRGTSTALNLDVYNVLNLDTVLTENSSYTLWRQPLSILKARFAKVSVQFNF